MLSPVVRGPSCVSSANMRPELRKWKFERKKEEGGGGELVVEDGRTEKDPGQKVKMSLVSIDCCRGFFLREMRLLLLPNQSNTQSSVKYLKNPPTAQLLQFLPQLGSGGNSDN